MVLLFPESKPYEKLQEVMSPEHHVTTSFLVLFLAFLYVRINICICLSYFFLQNYNDTYRNCHFFT